MGAAHQAEGVGDGDTASPLDRELAMYSKLLAPYQHKKSEGPSQELHPWVFWKKYADKLPILSTLARNLLTFPASSAESERAFRYVRLLVTDNRACLKPEMVRALMMLYLWERHPHWVEVLRPIAAAPVGRANRAAALDALEDALDAAANEVEEQEAREAAAMKEPVAAEEDVIEVDDEDEGEEEEGEEEEGGAPASAGAAAASAAKGGAVSGSKRKRAQGGAGTGLAVEEDE